MSNTYTIDLLNAIRTEASEEYQNRIPEASRENFAQIGQAFNTYTVQFNEFHNALMHKIGKTIVEHKMFTNPLARFKSGGLTSPHDVEEIFIEMSKAEGAFDPNGPNPLGRRQGPDTKVIYHRQNREDKYVVTIGDRDLLAAFTSPEALETFITGKLNSIYSGDNYDEFLAMKNVLATYGHYYEVPVKPLGGEEYDDTPGVTVSDFRSHPKNTAEEFVKAVRRKVKDFKFPNTAYNAAGVRTFTETADLVLFINKDVSTEIDVELLAKAFATSHTDLSKVPDIVELDDFGTLEDCYAILVDKDFFRIWDTLTQMEPQRNADGLFTNWFFHHHQILSASTFKNAAMFKKVHKSDAPDNGAAEPAAE